MEDTLVVINARKSKFAKTPVAPFVVLVATQGAGEPIDLSDQKKMPLIFACMIVKKNINRVLPHDLGVGLRDGVKTGSYVQAVGLDASVRVDEHNTIVLLDLLNPFTKSGKWKARVGACIVAKKLMCQTDSSVEQSVGFSGNAKLLALAFVQETEDQGACPTVAVVRVFDMSRDEETTDVIEMFR